MTTNKRRHDIKQPELQNIALRTDLGTKLRAALREQRPMPRALQSANFNALEMKTHAHYCAELVKKEGDDIP